MDSICVNTTTLSNVVNDLNNTRKYYNNKKNTFYAGAFSSSSNLSNYINKVRSNYVDIHNNIMNVALLLEDYYKDIEGIENKFSNNTGYIDDSSTSSIASKYAGSLIDYTVSEDDLFEVNKVDDNLTNSTTVSDVELLDVDDVSSASDDGLFKTAATFISNTFDSIIGFINGSIETEAVIEIDDPIYQEALDLYLEQLDEQEVYIQEYLEAYNAQLEEYSVIDDKLNEISNAAARGYETSSMYDELQALCESFGFQDYSEYVSKKEELESGITDIEYAIHEVENYKLTAKYDILSQLDSYIDYEYSVTDIELDYDILNNIRAKGSEHASPYIYSYKEYVEEYGEVDELDFLVALAQMDKSEYFVCTDLDEELFNLAKASKYNEELLKMYEYLLETQGEDVASQYLSDMEDTINSIVGKAEAQITLDNMSDDGTVIGAIGNEVKATGTGFFAGLDTFISGIENAISCVKGLFTDDDPSRAYTVEEYKSMYIIQGLESGDYDGALLAQNYQLSEGIGNMVPSILVSYASGGLGSVVLGVSSGGNSYHSALVDGATNLQAITYGIISGATEALTERFLGGLPGLSDVNVTGLNKTFLLSMIKEGNEEAVQELFDSFMQYFILQNEDAFDGVLKNMATSWAYGAVTAGVLQSTGAIVNTVRMGKISSAITNGDIDTTTIVEKLKAYSQEYDLGLDLDGKTDTQIIGENPAIVYSLFASEIESSIDGVTTNAEVSDSVSSMVGTDIQVEEVSDSVKSKSTNTSIKIANDITLSAKDFNALSVDEQIEYLNNASKEQIYEILEDTSFDEKVAEVLNNIIIENQDMFLDNDSPYPLKQQKVISYILSNLSLLSEISNDNLLSMLLSDRKSTILLNEIYRRIDNGDAVLDKGVIAYRNEIFNFTTVDSLSAYLALSPEYQNKAINLMNEEISNLNNDLSDNLRKLLKQNKEKNNVLFHSAVAKLYYEGKLNDASLSLLTELLSNNNDTFSNLNLNLLESTIVEDLGSDFIKSIIYDKETSRKIQSLHTYNINAYNLFVEILNECKSDVSLSTSYSKISVCLDYLYNNLTHFNSNNLSDINIDDFINYCIYYSNYSKSYLSSYSLFMNEYQLNYFEVLSLKCDEQFEKAYNSNLSDKYRINVNENLTLMKDAILTKYYCMSLYEAKEFLIKYGTDIESLTGVSDETYKFVKSIESLVELDNPDVLLALYNDNDFEGIDFEALLYIEKSLQTSYNDTYIDALSNTESIIQESIKNGSSNVEYFEYNDKTIPIVNLNDDFSLIVRSSSTGFKGEIELSDNSYVSSWNNKIYSPDYILASSYITESNIGTAPIVDNGVLYAFTNVDEESIVMMGSSDINSNVKSFGFSSGNQQIYYAASNMSKYTTRVYNEVDLDINSVTPDYIVIYSDSSTEIIENSLKAAAEWNIPIIRIDKTKLAIQQAGKINDLLIEFKDTENIDYLTEAIDLYESNVSGYKLNSVAKEAGPMVFDATAGINNQEVADLGVFDSIYIENEIADYIDKLSSMEHNSEKVDELIGILEIIDERYSITNKTGGSVSFTKSGIDTETLISMLEEIRKE